MSDEIIEPKVEGKKEEKNYFSDVDWRVFTQKQATILKDLAMRGLPQLMASSLNHIRPEQEYQLQVLVDILSEKDELPESTVKAEIIQNEMKGEIIRTPAEEAVASEGPRARKATRP